MRSLLGHDGLQRWLDLTIDLVVRAEVILTRVLGRLSSQQRNYTFCQRGFSHPTPFEYAFACHEMEPIYRSVFSVGERDVDINSVRSFDLSAILNTYKQ